MFVGSNRSFPCVGPIANHHEAAVPFPTADTLAINLASEFEVNKANFGKLAAGKTQGVGAER